MTSKVGNQIQELCGRFRNQDSTKQKVAKRIGKHAENIHRVTLGCPHLEKSELVAVCTSHGWTRLPLSDLEQLASTKPQKKNTKLSARLPQDLTLVVPVYHS